MFSQLQGEGSTAVAMLYGTARLLAFAALALLVGAAFFVAAWWPGAGRYPAMQRLIWAAWAVLVAATVAVLLLFGPQAAAGPLRGVVDSDLLSATLDTSVGTAMLLRLLVLSLAAPCLALLLSRRASPTRRQRAWRVGGVLGGAALLGVTWSIAGHSAAGRQAVISIPVDVVHLAAMGVWLGGLVVLCGVLLRTGELTVMRAAVPSFSRTAMVCVAVLVVTGAYQGWRQVGEPGALVSTSYGWLLLGKVLLVLLLVGLGATSRSWVRRHYAPTTAAPRSVVAGRPTRKDPGRTDIVRFRRVIIAEAGLAAVVLGVTVVLVTSQPARTAQIAAAAQQHAAQQAAQEQTARPAEPWPTPTTVRLGFDTGGPAGPGVVDLVVFPAAVGSNQIHISVLDAAAGLLDVPELTVTLSRPDRAAGPLAVPLQKLAPGHYIGTTMIPLAGQWLLAVTVRTSDVDQDTSTTPIDVR